jgi:hypothetical protein
MKTDDSVLSSRFVGMHLRGCVKPACKQTFTRRAGLIVCRHCDVRCRIICHLSGHVELDNPDFHILYCCVA